METKAFEVFNEGVTLSLQAGEFAQKQDFDRAEQLNLEAIEKFKETLRLDSSHVMAASSIGHNYFLNRKFEEAISWFTQSIALQPDFAPNHYEMGMCKINLGNVQEGEQHLDQARKLDPSDELKEIIYLDLYDVGTLAFEFGMVYEKQGEVEKGIGYKKFAIAVLWTAQEVDSTRGEARDKIVEFATAIGDMATANRFRRE